MSEKEISWEGSSLQDLLDFPKDARKSAGFQLRQVQRGLNPNNWKAFDSVGAGVKEIRIHDTDGIYRVMYVAKFEEAIYVLHCFQKKTKVTSKHDKKIAQTRYDAVIHKRKEKS